MKYCSPRNAINFTRERKRALLPPFGITISHMFYLQLLKALGKFLAPKFPVATGGWIDGKPHSDLTFLLFQGIASFISYAADAGICIAITEKILRNSHTEDFDRIIEKLLQKAQARAVVLFVDEDNTRLGGKKDWCLVCYLYSSCRKLLQATIRANRTGHFLWIGSDSWGAKVHPVRDQEYAAEGAITILPHRNAIRGNLYR